MSPKRILLVGTMALTISIGGGIWDEEAKAAGTTLNPYDNHDTCNLKSAAAAAKDPFLHLLGVSKDEEVHEALYNGQSLADLAAAHDASIDRVIEQQVSELTAQLDERLAKGMIPLEQYEAQKAELVDIVTRSAYGQTVA
jgi:hypothetical protein